MDIKVAAFTVSEKSSNTYTFQNWLDTGMQTGDKASSSISLADRSHLVKMLITLDPNMHHFAGNDKFAFHTPD